MVSSLYAFPGEGEADAWLTSQRDRLLTEIQSGGSPFSEVTDSPALGDATVAFAVQRPIDASDELGSGFRIYTRSGPIVAMVEIVTAPEIGLRAAAGLMEQQLACIAAQGCTGSIRLPAALFGNGNTARAAAEASPAASDASTPAAGAQPSESVITIEGEGDTPEATRAPREDRERRRDRRNQEEAAATEAAG
jgi:hypothetical protein